jgi:small-conductance mechanosensitive channel
MAIFQTDLQALLYIIIIGISLYVINKIISKLFIRIRKIKVGQRNKIMFAIRLISIILLIYFIIEGFPSFTMIPEQYSVVISGAISTALAFASSGIFSNIIAGILIWIVDPIDIGDVVKIKEYKGIIKSITLTKVVIETFERIIIEISNTDVISSKLLNYSIKLKSRKKFFYFKRKIRTPQDIGNARLDIDIYNEKLRKKEESDIKSLFERISEKNKSVIHLYTFKMAFPFEKFRIKVDKIEKLCENYSKSFGFTPKFHIIDFDLEIIVKFRIITIDSNKLLIYKSQFVKEVSQIIMET